MRDIIKKSLKERCKLPKFFHKSGLRKIDHDKVLEKSEECTKQIFEAKKNYILKMTKKLADSNTSSKSYWKNSQQYQLSLSMVRWFQIFVKKQTFLITFLSLYAHLYITQAVYRLFHREQGAGSNPFKLLKMIY